MRTPSKEQYKEICIDELSESISIVCMISHSCAHNLILKAINECKNISIFEYVTQEIAR